MLLKNFIKTNIRRARAITEKLTLALICVFSCSSLQAYASLYIPSGVQNDVTFEELSDWGWTLCYSGSYSDTESISFMFQDCDGDFLIIGGGVSGFEVVDTMAAGHRDDILTYTPKNMTTIGNNVQWYYNASSMGFAGLDRAIDQNTADYNDHSDRSRLSWHTWDENQSQDPNNEPAEVFGGWRAGNNTDLGDGWSRYIFQATLDVPVDPPVDPVEYVIDFSELGLNAIVTDQYVDQGLMVSVREDDNEPSYAQVFDGWGNIGLYLSNMYNDILELTFSETVSGVSFDFDGWGCDDVVFEAFNSDGVKVETFIANCEGSFSFTSNNIAMIRGVTPYDDWHFGINNLRYSLQAESPAEPAQIISISNDPSAIPGRGIELELSYNTSDNNNQLAGLGMRLHFDSSILSLNSISGLVEQDIIVSGEGPFSDDSDFDNDPLTDQFILFGWASLYNSWPNVELPTILMNVVFDVSEDVDTNLISSTNINFTDSSFTAGYNFNAETYELLIHGASWDFDGNGTPDALTDGLMMLRYLFGLTGEDVTNNAMAENSLFTSDETISMIENSMEVADIDSDGQTNALTDGLLLLRYLFDIRDYSLTNGVVGTDALRTSSEDIADYINQFMVSGSPVTPIDSELLIGIHNDVEISEILDLGYSICYEGFYADENFQYTAFFDSCDSDELIVAAGRENSSIIDVMASGNINAITTITGYNETILADNGVRWYLNPDQSMGFVGADDIITQSSADVNEQGERDRLSWHLDSGGRVDGGWRSGSNTGLNDSYDWKRYIFSRN